MNMKTLLITGGAGFIGTKLVEKLRNTYRITVLDNLDPQIHGTAPDMDFIRQNTRFVQADIRDTAAVEACVAEADYLVHLAAQTGTGQSMYHINQYTDVNCMGTSVLMEAVTKHRETVAKVVVASSRAVYGEGKYSCAQHGVQYPGPRLGIHLAAGRFEPVCPLCQTDLQPLATDEGSNIRPASVYGLSKYYQEELVKISCAAVNVPYVGFRFQNVYGVGQSLRNPYTGILSIFSTLILNGKPINIFEDGLESRDFIYVDDVVNALEVALKTSAADNTVLNLGSGIPTPVNEVLALLVEAYGRPAQHFVSGNYRVGDIRHNFADIRLAEEKLGFRPKVTLPEGIRRLADWVLTQNPGEIDYQKSMDEMREKNLYK